MDIEIARHVVGLILGLIVVYACMFGLGADGFWEATVMLGLWLFLA